MWKYIVIWLLVFVTIHSAEDKELIILNKIYRMAENVVNVTTEIQQDYSELEAEGRKSKFLPFLPFHALCE